MNTTTVKTPPVIEPVSLVEAKDHLRVDITDDDALIQGRLRAARRHLERRYACAFLTQTLVLTRDNFGCWNREPIKLRSPAVSVSSVTYVDPSGSSIVWGSSNYVLVATQEPARLYPALTTVWPTTAAVPGAVKIEYVAGYTQPELVPDDMKEAVLLLLGHFYENREAVLTGSVSKEIELSLNELMSTYYTPLLR